MVTVGHERRLTVYLGNDRKSLWDGIGQSREYSEDYARKLTMRYLSA